MNPNWIVGTLAVLTILVLAVIEILHERRSRRRRKDPASSVRPRDMDPQRRP